MVSAPSPVGPLDDGTTTAAELTVPPATEVRMWPDACIGNLVVLMHESGVAYGVTAPPITGARRCVW